MADAESLAHLFSTLDALPVPLVGRIHGAALGGGSGLAAVCDIVVAEESAVFGFTEVKLGIIPAVISPFVLAKVGRSAARELFLTGRRFSAAHARDIALVHKVVPPDALDDTVDTYVADITSAGPEAVQAAKSLIRDVWDSPASQVGGLTARAIATRRVSVEGQEGLRAFLEKRKPTWS
jgi:methylglutaconyl-CoA hydratase